MATRPYGPAGPGFIDQMRSLHWAVKLILLVVLGTVTSPLILGVGAIAYVLVGPVGIVLELIGLLVFGAWFIASPTPRAGPPATGASGAASGQSEAAGIPKYCSACGASMAVLAARCPQCDAAWAESRAPETIATLAAQLNDLASLRRRNAIDAVTYSRMRSLYEGRMAALRPAPQAATAPPPTAVVVPPRPTPAPAAAAEQPAQPAAPMLQPKVPVVPRPAPTPSEPRPSAADVGRSVVGWAAERQADILLYVGAFLLSVAAVIFVAYQGEALNGTIRFAILTAYAVGFLGFGLALHRWERVREAGPVFLVLGAILIPVDFVALRTQVLTEDEVPLDVLWLFGSATTAVLYFVLAVRGYGRLYIVPAIPAALAAWGSLASVAGLPYEWFGAWFMLVAAPTYVLALSLMGRWKFTRWLIALALLLGFASLAWAHGRIAATEANHSALPAAYALATVGLAAGLWFRRDALALLALPVFAGMTVGTAWWAWFALEPEWVALIIAASGMGYLVIAHFRATDARRWAALTAVASAAALLLAHVAMGRDGADQWALPATYALVFAGALASYIRWRWLEPAAALPPLGALTALTAWWASQGLAYEWYGLFAAFAALGYLALTQVDRKERTRLWQWFAADFGIVALAVSHAAIVLEDSVDRAALPITYGVVLLGAGFAFARWRWEWRVAPAAIPALAAMTALTAAWAQWDLDPEWYGCFAVGAGLGYLMLGHFDGQEMARGWGAGALVAGVAGVAWSHLLVLTDGAERAALPAAYALAFVGVAGAFARWRWIEAGALLPPLAAMTALTAAWAQWDLDREWYGCFAVAAGLGYLLLGHFDRREMARNWGAGALAAGVAGVAWSHWLVLTDGAERAALPAAYAMAFVGVAGAFGRWRWAEAGALLPPLAAMTALTSWWASAGLAVEWYGAFAAAAALGYVALALFDRAERAVSWLYAGALAAVIGLVMAHVTVAGDPDATREALPATYAIVLVASAIAFAGWRFAWRVAPWALPLAAMMTALTFSWARWGMDPEWYGAFAVAGAFGYVALSKMDSREWARTWLAFGMGAGAAGVFLAQVTQAPVDANHAAVPVAYGEAFAASVVATALWRWYYREAVAAIPPLAAAFGASLIWAAYEMPLEWLTAWGAAAAAGYLVPAFFDRLRQDRWRTAAAIGSAGALALAHVLATAPELAQWQLPVTYGIVLAAASWDAARYRETSVLAPPILASMFGATVLWAAGAGQWWWPYPALGVAGVMAATSHWWQRNRVLRSSGWLYLVLLVSVATVAVLPVDYSHPAHGVVAQVAAAAVLAIAAFGARGSIAALLVEGDQPLQSTIERVILIQGSFAFLFGAGASLNGVLELGGAERSWTIAGLGVIAWLFAAVVGRNNTYYWAFVPVALAGMTIAALVAADSEATLTAVLVVATVMPAVAYAGTRRWMLLGAANSFLFVAMWAGWEWQNGNLAYLPLAYAGVAALEWIALLRLRRYTPFAGELEAAVMYVSWGPWLVSGMVAGLLLAQEQDRLASSESIVRTEEWILAAAVLAMASAAVMGEGIRLRLRWVWLPGSAGLLTALLMAIATQQPENIQAYTAPIGAYLVLTTLTFRTSPYVVEPHLHFHEAVMLAGVLFLVLPPAEQSFEPGGGKYGLELIGIGLALLAVGLVFHARWLVPASIATLTGVSIRLVTGGLWSAPYWLLLGVAGTALIGFGLLVLLERERWDHFRHRVVEWWSEASRPGGPLGPPAAPAGGRL